MTTRSALGASLSASGNRIPTRVAAAIPYTIISAYFALVIAGYGLHTGDLEDCTDIRPDLALYKAGGCPFFAGPGHANPWDAAVQRYHTWSGRFTVELTEYALSHTLWAFVVITMLLSWLFVWSARSLLEIRTAAGLTAFVGLFALLVPFQFHASAGVYSTVIFCSWAAFLGVFADSVIARLIRREPTSRWLVGATVPALLFALCSEQFAAAFTFAVGALAYQALGRQRTDLRAPLALYSTLWAAAVVNILICPGNQARKGIEIDNWMPAFATMSPVEKLAMGLHHALFLLAEPVASTAILAVLLALILLGAGTRLPNLSYVPGAVVLLWLGGMVTLSAEWDLGEHLLTTVATAAAILAAAAWGGYEITRHDRQAQVLTVALLVSGFAASMLMSFSPTVWGSDTRTLLLQYLALVAAVFLLGRCAWRHRPAPAPTA